MAADLGHASPPLNQLALRQYADFNVFQLMRLLLLRERGRNWPTSRRLRFRAELGASFQAREITRLRQEASEGEPDGMPERIVLDTPNYCIASELGPLPAPFLEWAREQQRHGPNAMTAFLNLFNQRIHVLRYELKQRSLRALDPARPENTRYAAQLAALLGLAQEDAQAQIPLPPRAWLGLAGLLVNNRRSAEVVATVMGRYLGERVRVHTLVGNWRNIESSECLSLGRRNHKLGQSSLLGSQMWDRQAGVRLEINRLNFHKMLSLLPLKAARVIVEKRDERALRSVLARSRHAAFVSLLQLLLDRRYDCEVEIKVETASIPLSLLTRIGVGLRLGQTAWLISRSATDATPPESVVRFCVPAYGEAEPRMAA